MSNNTSCRLFKALLDVHFLRAAQRNTRRTLSSRHMGSCGTVAQRRSLQLHPAPPPMETPSRSFISLAVPISTRRMEYCERRTLHFAPEQIYTVVANVDEYQHFVPWCKKSRMMTGPNGAMRAELEIGFPPITEQYTSELTFVPNHQIRAVCTDGSLFSHLETIWRFTPGAKDPSGSCKVDFFVSFEFRSLLHSQLACVFFDQVVKQMVGAFESRAAARYRVEPSSRRSAAVHNPF
ncbi:LOW QUALITY PROTEIN: coenzyme Q-binding protein COQ10 homolog, mitochondrial [Nematolebias whitei]|uniref:LOW QUALITY PROTEIN: coenzyme Q-binding protein COQ10 homolog, mitochondrial n=1 Tax=Nematolebias whitei TaxID=451745 RepID=UPI001897967C|nr:LOW QUALITY PROTEIN: coenzyme Q-binding protein COQ10 homolog, mitochondrial [Nematolebias whitei]